MNRHLKFKHLKSHMCEAKITDFISDIDIKWENPTKPTVGNQFVNAGDSLSVNNAEGFGRYSKADKIYWRKN